MGAIRSFSRHVRWTDTEINLLRLHYYASPWSDLYILLPTRTRSQIQNKANMLGLLRYRPPKLTPDEVRASKRAFMARRRAADPGAARAYSRAHHAKRRDVHNARLRESSKRHMFRSRANRLKGVAACELAALWRRQRGLCALTGIPLTRENAEVDHILPRARGGSDALDNLRWTTRTVNRAKRDMTDAEFAELCFDVMRWIGERIQLVDDLMEAQP